MKKYLFVIGIITFVFSSFSKVLAQANQTLNCGMATTFISFPKTGCVYNWTNSNADIGLPTSGMGDIPSFIAINSGTNPITATITATPEPACLPVTFTITVNPNASNIVTSGALSPLSTVYGTASTSTSFILTDKSLQNDISIVPPTGFEVSTDNISFSNTLNIKGENSNALLNFIKVSPDIIRESEKGFDNYIADVEYNTTTLQITPVAANPNAIIKINDIIVKSGTVSPAISLNTGHNLINIVVTARDGVTTKTYTLDVRRAPSTDATLKNLTINNSALSPAFAAKITDYVTRVGSAINDIQLTPTTSSADATISINGIITASGTASAPIRLQPGNNIIPVAIIAQDGTTLKTYTVTIIRSLSNNADISQLSLTVPTTITQTPGTNNYIATVEPLLPSTRIIITANDANAMIRINGIAILSGTESNDIPLNSSSTAISIAITSQDGKSIKTYNVMVTKTLRLTNIVLNPASTLTLKTASGSINYVTSVDAAVTNVKETFAANDPNAIVLVNGIITSQGTPSASIPLNNTGTTTITTVITSADGTTSQKYTIVISKNGSSNTTLTNLSLSPSSKLTYSQVSGALNYTTSVNPSITSVQLTCVLSDSKATIKINGTAVASGVPSALIPLNSTGITTITAQVTARDGASIQLYTIQVSKNGSANTNVKQITLTPTAVLAYAGVLGSVNYSTSVAPSVTSVQQTVVTEDPSASVRVNGILVPSGTASEPLVLNSSGTTTITTVVTAQDGVTSQTYTILISKNGSTNTNLNSISLNPAATVTLTPGTNNYSTSVPRTTTSVQQITVTDDANATITINGIPVNSGMPSPAIPLKSTGSTIITTVITAQDGITKKTYLTTVNKNGSSNAALSQLLLSPGAPLNYQAAGNTNYTLSIATTVTSIQQTAITSDAGATLKVNGVNISSGAASAPIPLNNSGTTIITTVVTAQDGVTTKTYTITITHGSNNELLAPLPVDHILNTIYLRLAAKTPAGNYSGNILLSSSNANDAKVPIPVCTVKQSLLTVAIEDVTKFYGVTLYNGTGITQFTATGLKNNETLNTVIINYGAGALATAPAAVYPNAVIPVSVTGANGFLASNYLITYTTKDVMVMPAPLTITANPVYKNYGSALINVTRSAGFTITLGMLQNGNTINSVNITYGLGAAASDNGGIYPKSVIPSAAIGDNGFLDANYNINYTASNLTVQPVQLTVTTDNKTKDFGTDNPIFTLQYRGFVNNDSPAQLLSMPVATTTAVTRSPLGNYPITISGAESPNYTFKYITGTLTISAEHVVLSIPNTITPNGDGINDNWNIKNLDAYPNATVDIFDRYGHKVFSSIGGYYIAWDGSYNGSALPTGGYYYIINPQNKTKIMTGTITVIR